MRIAPAHPLAVMSLLAAATLASLSCATLGGADAPTFADVSALAAGARVPEDAAAIVLLREETIHVRGARAVTNPVTEMRTHNVIKILAEQGFDAAKQRVVIPPDGELVLLAARTITPDGRVIPVDPSTMHRTRTVIEGTAGAELRFFQFPNVEVGSVLELITVTRTTSMFWSWSSGASSPYPIATYRADVSTPRNVTFDLRVNNATVPPRQVPDPDGRQHVVLELKDVPAVADEIFTPAEHTGSPWWVYRVTEVRSTRGDQTGIVSWDRGVPFALAEHLYENKPIAGLPHLDASGCGRDVRCVVQKALETVRAREWSGFTEELEVRESKDLGEALTLNNLEKALVTWSLLRSADVNAQLAVLVRTPGFPVNKSFPAPQWFNHAVVRVPELGGLFLDPSCESCAPGQLPEWDLGSEALVAIPKSNMIQLETTWVPLTGEPLPANGHSVVYDAAITANGDVEVKLEHVATGEAAARVRLESREETEADSTRAWERFAQQRSASARVTASTPWACDRAQGRCRRTATLQLAGYAVVDGKAMLAPLQLLHMPLEEQVGVGTDPARRRNDVEVAESMLWQEELHLRAPSGFAFEAAPPAVDMKNQLGSARFEATLRDAGELVVTRRASVGLASVPREGFAQLARLVDALGGARSLTVKLSAQKPRAR